MAYSGGDMAPISFPISKKQNLLRKILSVKNN